MPSNSLDDGARARVIEMYEAGERLVDITRETHVPRATIYWVLQQAGISPSRMPKPSAEMMSVHDVLTRLQQVTIENGVLRERLRQAEALNEALMKRLDDTFMDRRTQQIAAEAAMQAATKKSRARKPAGEVAR